MSDDSKWQIIIIAVLAGVLVAVVLSLFIVTLATT